MYQHQQQQHAKIHTYETDMGNHYSVNMIDENGKVVSTQTAKTMNEAIELKQRWENGTYQQLFES